MRCTLLTLALVLPTSVAAQDRLDRFEALSERSTNMMVGKMIEMTGGDTASVPEFEWDAAMREAGRCMLEGYEAEIGAGGVTELFDRMDAFLDESTDLSLEEMSEAGLDTLPEGLTTDESIAITQDCGMVDLQLDWMSNSGLMQAMSGN